MTSHDSGSHARMHAVDVEDVVQRVTALLRVQGTRVTAPRRAVVRAMAGKHEPVAAEQVVSSVAAEGIHRASVYRSLDVLVEKSVLERRLSATGNPVYHLAAVPPEQQHVHLVCSVCGAVGAVPTSALGDVTERIESAVGFAVEPAGATLPGRCAQCLRLSRSSTAT